MSNIISSTSEEKNTNSIAYAAGVILLKLSNWLGFTQISTDGLNINSDKEKVSITCPDPTRNPFLDSTPAGSSQPLSHADESFTNWVEAITKGQKPIKEKFNYSYPLSDNEIKSVRKELRSKVQQLDGRPYTALDLDERTVARKLVGDFVKVAKESELGLKLLQDFLNYGDNIIIKYKPDEKDYMALGHTNGDGKKGRFIFYNSGRDNNNVPRSILHELVHFRQFLSSQSTVGYSEGGCVPVHNYPKKSSLQEFSESVFFRDVGYSQEIEDATNECHEGTSSAKAFQDFDKKTQSEICSHAMSSSLVSEDSLKTMSDIFRSVFEPVINSKFNDAFGAKNISTSDREMLEKYKGEEMDNFFSDGAICQHLPYEVLKIMISQMIENRISVDYSTESDSIKKKELTTVLVDIMGPQYTKDVCRPLYDELMMPVCDPSIDKARGI